METIQNAVQQLSSFIPPDKLQHLAKTLSYLRSHSHISIEVMQGRDMEAPTDYAAFRLKATQLEPTATGRIFLQKEIVDIVRQSLEEISHLRYYILPITFSPNFSVVDAQWINAQMNELGLKNADIGRQTGINKSTLSQLFTGSKPFTLMHKALFWHYFHGYRLARSYQQALEDLSNLSE